MSVSDAEVRALKESVGKITFRDFFSKYVYSFIPSKDQKEFQDPLRNAKDIANTISKYNLLQNVITAVNKTKQTQDEEAQPKSTESDAQGVPEIKEDIPQAQTQSKSTESDAQGVPETKEDITPLPQGQSSSQLSTSSGKISKSRKEIHELVRNLSAARTRGRLSPDKTVDEVARNLESDFNNAGGASSGSGASDTIEQQANPTISPNNAVPDPVTKNAQSLIKQTLQPVTTTKEPELGISVTNDDADESEDGVGQATTESTRQNELAANELLSLDYKPNFTEVMDPAHMRLATDAERGNLGAGTSARMQSADVWGNLFTTHADDLVVAPETYIKTDQTGRVDEEVNDSADVADVYSFLPFAKLGGVIVWIPRHVAAAKFFFTAQDYEELVSNVQDGDPLTLNKTNEVDSTMMMNTILKSYGTLKQFCQLNALLPMTASIEQIYAEWLEIRQIGKAVARYQELTGGMYENSDLSMKGGIRAAVASALRPFIQAWNQLHQNNPIAEGMPSGTPGSRPMLSTKRMAEAGVVEAEEYNPQLSYQPVEFKRVKFSIPSI